MLSRLRFTLLLPLAALLACASGSTPTVTNPSYTPVGGDYAITVGSGTAHASIFSGDLAVSGSTVTGVFRYYNPGTVCVSGSQDIPFTGTFTNNTLTLTSATFSSSVATLTIQLPLSTNTSGTEVANGTAVITGGTCVLASTTAQAQLIPSFAGTWSGTLTGPASGSASVVLTQGAADADGQFPVTGAISFTSSTSSACNFSIPISAPAPGLVSGTTLNVANANSTITITANAAVTPVLFTVTLNQTGTNQSSCLGSYAGALSN
jgi:hypothetical protein